MIPAPSDDVREYLKASGVVAVWIGELPGGMTVVRFGADPWDAAAAMGGQVVDLVWVWGEPKAIEGWHLTLAAKQSDMAVRTGSERLRAQWALAYAAPEIGGVPHGRALMNAQAEVEKANRAYSALAASGGLRQSMNQAYKEARLAGVKLPPFSVYEKTYRLEMIRAAARRAAHVVRPPKASPPPPSTMARTRPEPEPGLTSPA